MCPVGTGLTKIDTYSLSLELLLSISRLVGVDGILYGRAVGGCLKKVELALRS